MQEPLLPSPGPQVPPEEAPKKARHKRKVDSSESCVRTDLIELTPNAGKIAVLEGFFTAYRDACVTLVNLAWSQFLEGKSSPAWRGVIAPNPLAGRSTILQPAEASARSALASHLGWLGNDVAPRIRRAKRMLVCKARGDTIKLAKIDAFIHACYAINRSKAWMWQDPVPGGSAKKSRSAGVMKAEGSEKATAAPGRAYEVCKRLFLRASTQRRLPNASFFQVEATRGGSSMGLSEHKTMGVPEALAREMGLTLEVAAPGSAFPYWLRFAVHDTSADSLSTSSKSIVMPGLPCRSFEIRNAGRLLPGAVSTGPDSYPIHVRRLPAPKTAGKGGGRRARRHRKSLASNSMNPASIAPQAIESVSLIRKLDSTGRISYFAGVRSQMRDPFGASKKAYTPLVASCGIDWGINHLMATSEPLAGSNLHGSGLMKSKVPPLLEEVIRIQGVRQTEKEALAK